MKQSVWSQERGLRVLKDGADFAAYKERYPSAILIKKVPSIETLEKWEEKGYCKAIDGCKVEPDGECSHGYPSWLMAMNFI